MIPSEYYGDNVRWFIGKVEDNNDNILNLGRLRVRIHGIHSADKNLVADEDLPWANVLLPITMSGTANGTTPVGIQIGAMVFGIFLDGRLSQLPLVLGSMPHDIGNRVESSYEDVVAAPLEENKVSAQEATNNAVGEYFQTLPKYSIPNIKLTKGSNETKIFQYLKSYFSANNYPAPAQIAAAFVGNFYHESSCNPKAGPNTSLAGKALSKTDAGEIQTTGGQTYFGTHDRWGQENSYGIAQWNRSAGRFGNLTRFYNGAPNLGPPDSLGVQLPFVAWELENTHSWVANKLKKAPMTLRKANEIILRFYETPAVALNYNYQQMGKSQRVSTGLKGSVTDQYVAEREKRYSTGEDVYEKVVAG